MMMGEQQQQQQQLERIIIQNKYGEKLVGLLHDTGSKEVVVLCHGFRSNKDESTVFNIACSLEAQGISAFRFDLSGNGESEGNFEYAHYIKEAEDLDVVVKHFNGGNRVVSAIVGFSKGGGLVLLYASKHHDVRAIVSVSALYDMEGHIKRHLGQDILQRIDKEGCICVKDEGEHGSYRVTKESVMEHLNTNMHEACLKIDKDCRVLTVHGSADEFIPVQSAYEFAKIIPNDTLHIIQGADHGYTNHQQQLASAVLDFIKADEDTMYMYPLH